MTTPLPLLVAALDAHAAGLCVIPTATDGTKRPWPGGGSWDHYKAARPTIDDLNGWFGGGRYDGLGYVCGAVSGHLELLELEGRAVQEGYLARYARLLADHGLTELWERITGGYLEMTPSAGIHVLIRVAGVARKNTRLARRPSTPAELAAWRAEQQARLDAEQDGEVRARRQARLDGVVRGDQVPQVLIETRGEGGFVVVAPSAGRTHPTGAPWVLARGGPATIATVTEDERDALHAIAAMLDEMPAATPPAPSATRAGGNLRTADPDGVLRPGDDFNAKASWREILEPHGWRHTRNFGRSLGWTRPGKSRGISATTGTNDGDNLYVFSSSTEFETETPYSKFAAYALLEHGGNWSSATSALRAQGYGGPLPERDDTAELYALIAPTSPSAAQQGPPPFGGTEGALATVHQLPVSEPTEAPDEQEPITAEQAAANAFDREVDHELRKLKIREEAARRAKKARTGAAARPPIIGLAEFLAVPDEPARYRVDGLLPVGARAVLAAQFKAGKTTLVGNLIRSLVDSTPFLGRFPVQPFPGKVVLLDDELDERMVRRWLRDQGIENEDGAAVVALRGRLSSFDILDPEVRSEWATALREAGASIVVLDCLAPILDALGLSEDKEAGRFLVAFDELLKEAGVSEAIVVHHMGHSGERSRGASRLRDWPDVEWRLVREKDDSGEMDPAAPRYFSAYGRDVEVPESLLRFEASTRRLELTGGSRKDAKTGSAMEAITEFLTLAPGSSGRQIEDAITGDHPQKAVREALKELLRDRRVRKSPGARGAHLHWLTGESSALQDHKKGSSTASVNSVSAGQIRQSSALTHSSSISENDLPPKMSASQDQRTQTAGQSPSALSALPVRHAVGGECISASPLKGNALTHTPPPPPDPRDPTDLIPTPSWIVVDGNRINPTTGELLDPEDAP